MPSEGVKKSTELTEFSVVANHHNCGLTSWVPPRDPRNGLLRCLPWVEADSKVHNGLVPKTKRTDESPEALGLFRILTTAETAS